MGNTIEKKNNYKRKKYYTLVVGDKHNWNFITLGITKAKRQTKSQANVLTS